MTHKNTKTISRVFAKAVFTNLNSTKKVRILFVESEVEMDLRKRRSSLAVATLGVRADRRALTEKNIGVKDGSKNCL